MVQGTLIGRGLAAVRSLLPSDRPLDLSSLVVATVGGAARPALEVLADTHTSALVVLHEGRVAAEWYAAPELEETALPLHSVTKSWIGTLAGQLLDDGLLAAEELARAYVPELAHGGYHGVRVRDLLDMRTGGDYVEVHGVPGSELSIMGSIAGWEATPPPAGERSLRAYAATISREAQPGGPFSYRSLDTEALAWVLERASGRPLVDLLGERLFGAIGPEADAEMVLDGVGDPVASGGMSLRARDLARFGQMLLDGGSVGSRQVVPSLFLKDTRMGAPDSVEAFLARAGERPGAVAPSPAEGMYRNQFWVPRRGGRQLIALGVHGQALVLDGANQVVAVKLSQWPEPQSPPLFTDGMTMLSAAAEALGGEPQDNREILR